MKRILNIFLAGLRQLQAKTHEVHRKLVAQGKEPSPDDPSQWVAEKESGYVNCLLTVLTEGTTDSAIIMRDQGVPDLKTLARGNASLAEWTSKLEFPYEDLSADAVIAILIKSFDMQSSSSGRRRALLARQDGSSLTVFVCADRISDDRGLKISILRPEAEKSGRIT